MPAYHPDAETELADILATGGREVKRCLGMMVQRHLRIEDGTAPLGASELLPASGPSLQPLYQVEYVCGWFSRVTVVYEVGGAGAVVLAVDAWQGLARVGAAASAADAQARSWGRAS